MFFRSPLVIRAVAACSWVIEVGDIFSIGRMSKDPAPAPSPPPPPPPAPAPPPFVLEHDSRARIVWDSLQFVVVLSMFAVVPYRIGFNVTDWRSWIAVDIVIDVLLWLDVALNCVTSFEQEGDTVKSRAEIRRNYLRSWLIADVLSVVPIDLCCLAVGAYTPVFRGNRLIRVFRFVTYFSNWEKASSLKPTVIRLLKSIFIFFVAVHFFACTFHLILVIEGPDNSLLFQGATTLQLLNYSAVSQYFRSFYWAVAVFTGYNNPSPTTMLESVFMIIVTMTGIIYTGAVIGAVGEMMTNMDHSKLYFRQTLDTVQDFMDHRRLPAPLQNDVKAYYDYLWKTGKALERNELLTEMPSFLKDKMNFHMNREIISKVPLFKEYAEDVLFISEIIKCLKAVIWLPNFFVVRKGEVGTEMFFISRGELNVVNEEEKVVFTLRDGGFFGEIALVYDTKRTATIVARTFCDMFILKNDDFKKVMRKFPEQYKGIQKIAKERFQKIVDDEKKKEAEQAAARAKGSESPPAAALCREASLRRKVSHARHGSPLVSMAIPESEVQLFKSTSIVADEVHSHDGTSEEQQAARPFSNTPQAASESHEAEENSPCAVQQE